MDFDYNGRVEQLRLQMDEQAVDTVLLSFGADLSYLTGYQAMDSERLTMFVVTRSDSILVLPALEAPRVVPGIFELRSWAETEDPLDVVASLAGRSARTAIGDHTRASFLLGLQKRMSPDWVPASHLTGPLRVRKDDAELDALRAVAGVADAVAARIPADIRFSGLSEVSVAQQVQALLVEEGHDVAGFAIVAAGPNGASPHHSAGGRLIGEGDVIVMDFGGTKRGYWSDTTRTFVVGDPTSRQREIHGVVAEAQAAARRVVAPGVPCEEVDAAARNVIEAAGFGEFFIHRTGHGIGLEVHEEPYIVDGNSRTLEEGMVFSIEPGIYLPGELGVRIEDIVACTASGGAALNNSDRELIAVE